MAHLFRGKQAGIAHDLSIGISPEVFMLDEFARYGVNSQISALAYDPVQSLLAIGTNESQFGPGIVTVYGQKRVCVTFTPPRRSSIRTIQFCADKLVVLDSKNDISVFSLDSKHMLANYAPPGHVTAILTDPNLDYCLSGLQNGDIVAYDLDREAMTPFKIPNLWRERNPRARILPIVSMQFHPKDIGTVLIGYSEGAVIYSFKQNMALKFFQYEVPRGAPGGDGDPAAINETRHPRLTHAIWHPTGTFILTAHEDSSLVFWDLRDGRAILARTIEETDVNIPGRGSNRAGPGAASVKEPYFHIAWCSKENADDTGLLLAGGSSTTNPTKGLTFIELGVTPNYQTSSWEYLAGHFRNPKRVHILPTPPNAHVTTFLIIPRTSPHFAGTHDPIAVLAALGSGELLTLSFPSGHPITPTNQLHVSLSFVHPFITKTALAYVDRTRWLGMREVRQHGPNILLGGAPGIKPLKRHENRNIIQAAHADGTIRVWDAGHGDTIENPTVLQVDLGRAVGRWDQLEVAQMSMSGATGELSVGLVSGELVIFRLNRNQFAGQPPSDPGPNEGAGKMTDISRRADPGLKEGLLPLTMTNDQQGPVTALKHSDIGFVAVAYSGGGVTLVDLRGPAIIHSALLNELSVGKHGKSTKRRSTPATQSVEYGTTMEFGIMTLEGDDYSSLALFVGTSQGRLATFKILPSQTGRYSAQFAGVAQISDDRVISISPMDTQSGAPAAATGPAMAGLQSGRRVDGVVLVTTVSSAHIFRPASGKGASKTFDRYFCDSASLACYEERGYALVGLFGDGSARAFSIPALKEIASTRVNHMLDTKRFADAIVTPTGDILAWTGPSELAMVNVFGAGLSLPPSTDLLYDSTKLVPPRPTISNLQWIAGTQYITPSDMDVLIGGPTRPPSKRMVAEMQAAQEAEFQRQREAARTGRAPKPDASQETYWAYMQRQLAERTENLGLAGDSMDRAAEASSSWSDDVSKFVAKQKRQAALGFVSSKFGF
ncbi:Lethal(2) giant larvae sro7 [Elasticomyces elasticus]|uniref:Lethal(2) giant larvae sro7 n=1 Tax=Exophiala sideris TaxID=1016849 RepID=A0ABR0JCU2_9EURO|nr:Lethal(2) giant larvae sro7 [Elasticomyces elasticus]KAK5031290.1 Lethal(2) giant larvae sro7 [Exophiala sideris]KAK5039010.1 Lethal(2) giant larvae sro7 [Exophiala sideris]KAK5060895.1 Lethal(2) giant larvae sro7 [Exophiala sideris]KAK5183806.1 Lethal(2) giant larvae sro7 [Eurotiomycetes sp. CCFEE 6388]